MVGLYYCNYYLKIWFTPSSTGTAMYRTLLTPETVGLRLWLLPEGWNEEYNDLDKNHIQS